MFCTKGFAGRYCALFAICILPQYILKHRLTHTEASAYTYGSVGFFSRKQCTDELASVWLHGWNDGGSTCAIDFSMKHK